MGGTAVVIGGGLIGCSSAFALTGRGLKVQVLDAGTIGGGCSHGNCGYLCPSHVMPLAVPGAVGQALRAMATGSPAIRIAPRFDRSLWNWLWQFWRRCRPELAAVSARGRHALLQSSRSIYERWFREEGIDGELDETGLLLVFKGEREFAAHRHLALRLQSEFGIVTREIAGDDLTTFEPALVPGLGGGWWYRDDAVLHPDRVVAGLRQAAEKGGASFFEHVRVAGFLREGSRVIGVSTDRGDLLTDQVVIATGAEAPLLCAELGVRLPIQPGKGYSVTLPISKRMPKVPMVFEEHHVAVTPFRDALRIGSTMEFAGYDRSLNRERLALLHRSAAEHLIDPGTGPVLEEWFGWRPMTPDDLPVIGPVPHVEGVVLASGSGMIGLSTAPATGELVAEICSGVEPHLDRAPYAVDRFSSI